MALMTCSYSHESRVLPTLGIGPRRRTPVLAAEFLGLAANPAAAERLRQALPGALRRHALVVEGRPRAGGSGHALRPALDVQCAGGAGLAQPGALVGKVPVGDHRDRRHFKRRRAEGAHVKLDLRIALGAAAQAAIVDVELGEINLDAAPGDI